ncbi:hypothetical protein FACS189499_02810 [Clostridia bacterium]|nr:hypothetical protein FACS189499_02810 [Clostridia bacterium]
MSTGNNRIDDRLRTIADIIISKKPAVKLVCDVGTDRALLPCYLLPGGFRGRIIASDVNDGPLESARENISANGFRCVDSVDDFAGSYENTVTLIKSDGVSAYGGFLTAEPENPCDIVIAGMGGETILRIMTDFLNSQAQNAAGSRDFANIRFILQPMTKAERLRAGLYGNGFTIRREVTAEAAGRIYTIIEAAVLSPSALYENLDENLDENHPRKSAGRCPPGKHCGNDVPGIVFAFSGKNRDPRYLRMQAEKLRKMAHSDKIYAEAADAIQLMTDNSG